MYVHQIQKFVGGNEELCEEFKAPFLEYKPLWTVDILESLNAFLTDNSEPVAGAGDADGDDEVTERLDGPLAPKPEPPLNLFDTEINRYLKQDRSDDQPFQSS